MIARAAVRWSVLAAALAVACAAPAAAVCAGDDRPTRGRNAATAATRAANAAFEKLPLARPRRPRGRAARPDRAGPGSRDRRRGRAAVWDTTVYKFLEGRAAREREPEPVAPGALERHPRLFEVTTGIYQVRGYDVSNMTIIEGSTGRIVVDPLTTKETAAAAWKLVERALGKKPVSAVIFTHSHLDHFGGIEGVISTTSSSKRKVPVVAPARFLEEASSENVLAGVAMLRRAQFMYGATCRSACAATSTPGSARRPRSAPSGSRCRPSS
jgi:alkyl sulfatase BDS1-like metallo-beta-lactamase superfamily hydrolase